MGDVVPVDAVMVVVTVDVGAHAAVTIVFATHTEVEEVTVVAAVDLAAVTMTVVTPIIHTGGISGNHITKNTVKKHCWNYLFSFIYSFKRKYRIQNRFYIIQIQDTE